MRSDEGLYLAERSIPEGAPPLSANWQLLESNDELAQHGMLRLSATLIFALYQSDQIDHRRTKSTPCAAAAATA